MTGEHGSGWRTEGVSRPGGRTQRRGEWFGGSLLGPICPVKGQRRSLAQQCSWQGDVQ